MYREDVENYPKTYAKSNIDQIIESLDATRSMSLFAPSGFGKSSLTKFISFNQSYRSRYTKLKKIQFVYVNLSELSAETFEEASNPFTPLENNRQKRFLEILYRSFLEQDKTITSDDIQNLLAKFQQGDYKNNFYFFIEKFLKITRGKLIVIILDNMDVLNKQGFDSQKEFLKNFRDQYRTRMEYLFVFGELKELDNLTKKNWGNLIDIITQKILLMQISKVEECILPMHLEQNYLLFNLYFKHTQYFQEKLKLIKQWSGGFPPYFKYLFRYTDLDKLKNLIVDRELDLASERLLTSLDQEHVDVLKKLVKDKAFNEKSRGSRELLDMGIIVKENKGFRLFSPLFHHYIKSV